MPKIIAPEVEFSGLLRQMRTVTPEVFAPNGHLLNLMEGRWQEPAPPPRVHLGHRRRPARLDAHAHARHGPAHRVQDCLTQLRPHVELVGKLIMWEIGKTYKLGFTDIDRAVEGVQWYVNNIEGMLGH